MELCDYIENEWNLEKKWKLTKRFVDSSKYLLFAQNIKLLNKCDESMRYLLFYSII